MFRFSVLVFYLIPLYCVYVRSQLVRERMELMNRHILHQNISRCSQVKARFYETCEIHDNADYKVIGNECAFDDQKCSDGSYNKTCIILYINEDGSQSYKCTCHDHKKPQVSTVEYHWSRWHSLADSRVGLYREMEDALATNPSTLAREYRWVKCKPDLCSRRTDSYFFRKMPS